MSGCLEDLIQCPDRTYNERSARCERLEYSDGKAFIALRRNHYESCVAHQRENVAARLKAEKLDARVRVACRHLQLLSKRTIANDLERNRNSSGPCFDQRSNSFLRC